LLFLFFSAQSLSCAYSYTSNQQYDYRYNNEVLCHMILTKMKRQLNIMQNKKVEADGSGNAMAHNRMLDFLTLQVKAARENPSNVLYVGMN